jgi:DNA-directed RNA polymerase specialized sigma24 family protein
LRSPNDARAITAARFARLLAKLHADEEQAGLAYEHLRRALVRFFDWRGAPAPDECADDTLDRLAKRLSEDAGIADATQYAYGIARLVLLERRRQPVSGPLDQLPPAAMAAPVFSADPDEPLRECFDRCLDELPADGRTLVLRNYEGERDVKISNRRQLAAAHGLSDNALRSRVQRLRDGLETCVRACTAARERSAS